MALTENDDKLNVYLSDYGVRCQNGRGTALKGNLHATAEHIASGYTTTIGYLLTYRTSELTSAVRRM